MYLDATGQTPLLDLKDFGNEDGANAATKKVQARGASLSTIYFTVWSELLALLTL